MNYHYTTHGLQDGSCGHRHRTLAEAERCRLERRKCVSLSDRTIQRCYDDGRRELLDVYEVISVTRLHKKGSKNG